MNKFVRIKLLLLSKCLRLCKFISNEKYRKVSNYYFKSCGVVFHGTPKYINYDIDFDLTHPGLIHIGNNTVIAKQTVLLTHDFSIECGLEAIGKAYPDYEMQFLKEIHIGNDCFIGARSFILPGVTIVNNCIVGAGSVVSGNIPDNSLVAGNPATIICKTTSWAEKKYAEKKFVKGTIKYKKSNT